MIKKRTIALYKRVCVYYIITNYIMLLKECSYTYIYPNRIEGHYFIIYHQANLKTSYRLATQNPSQQRGR
jgi:hypothetical protein